MMQPDSVLLFAAGLGTRMKPLTDTRPKPLIDVAGRTLLDHALSICGGLACVVNCHYLGEQIIDHVKGKGVAISDERDALLETGGGLKKALPLLGDGPVCTLNTDAVWAAGHPLQDLTSGWRSEGMEGLLLLVPTVRAAGHKGPGDFDLRPDGQIVRGTDYVYTGFQIITTDRLGDIDDAAFSMWRLWDGMLKRGTLHGAVFEGAWCDVGQPESIAMAEAMLKAHEDV